MNDDQDFEALMERSSLGAKGDRRVRARTSAGRVGFGLVPPSRAGWVLTGYGRAGQVR